MRKALVLFALVASFAAAGCRSYQGDGCSCEPKQECCWRWQPGPCNSWDWYVPRDMEGCTDYQGSNCAMAPNCAPCAK